MIYKNKKMKKRIIINNKTDSDFIYLLPLINNYLATNKSFLMSGLYSFDGEEYIISPKENKNSYSIYITKT